MENGLMQEMLGKGLREVMQIHVKVTGFHSVESERGTVNMVLFSGSADGECFTGNILPGGVDTQTFGPRVARLSARYMLEGTDFLGQNCKLFIDNQGDFGADGSIRTNATIRTDSRELAERLGEQLQGFVENIEGSETEDIVIHFFI